MINLSILKLSAFDEVVLKQCPTIYYGASFIKYIAYFPIVASFFSGLVALSVFNISLMFANFVLGLVFLFIHAFIIKNLDIKLHKHRNMKIMLVVIVSSLLLAFFQTIFISSYLFKTEFQIFEITNHLKVPHNWSEKYVYFYKKIVFVFSFKNNVVSFITVSLNIVLLFIGLLPFILTFSYKNSTYYKSQEIIENFKNEYE